jgi:alanyl-tRNA synthetase
MRVDTTIEKFNRFSRRAGVLVKPGSPLLSDDPTLLFVNSGMAPFKPAILAGAGIQTTAVAQKCVRVRFDGSLFAFHMLSVVGESRDFAQSCHLMLGFLVDVIGLPSDQLHFIVNPRDDIFLGMLINVPASCIHFLDHNTEDYWVEWQFGRGSHISGRGITILFDTQKGGDLNDGPLNRSHRFLPLGNFVILSSNDGVDRYFDIGFGAERLASAWQDGDAFMAQPLADMVQALIDVGCKMELSRTVVRNMCAVCALADEGVRPSARGHGYVLRKLIRRTCDAVQASEEPIDVEQAVRAYLSVGHDLYSHSETGELLHLVTQEVLRYEEQLARNQVFGSRFLASNPAISTERAFKELIGTFGLSISLAGRLLAKHRASPPDKDT